MDKIFVAVVGSRDVEEYKKSENACAIKRITFHEL
jgi:hypothetical protein